MKKNMGALDRIIRLLVAAVIVYFYYNQLISGFVGILLLIISIVFVLTSLVGMCPLYILLGIQTCRMKKQHP
ncbi:YgaP family membrane protein [Paraflavitalea pollutisoli]|uniref:YgaP family membrane protein n=1 Tax=Paraflavitalea pollutisoli TaxID=3034143 RepID=UPI0023EAE035|nr:DUF2892 domain-containing protein [Paraflavitalea sp. H1-2-19X]